MVTLTKTGAEVQGSEQVRIGARQIGLRSTNGSMMP